ncbi:MAX dimerization protein MGA a isoform X3 [Anabas testudineus]|uniref:MAX dimerization protein MGA a isoform X3 n=1 Tax=Anabas testudineus TaxID=64144 RepID=UPI000E45F6A8|nr:MAX dimerization protein MGA a isoform X3 [Anabas testudineus]
MAFKKKQKGMVFHQEGAVAPTAAFAVDHPPTYFVPKPAKASKGSIEQISYATNDEPDMMGKHNIYSSRVATRTSGGLPVVKHPTSSSTHSDILPADSICKGVRVTLDNNSMWNEFYRCKTEMILTKQGSRMFPYCRFRISGLNPSRKYSLIMDILPLDNSRYKWTGKSWQVAGKAECHVKNEPFAHPESPSTGQHWMQNPVSFYKLKLTNNISDQDGNTIIHPMHRYLPRLYVVQTEKAAKDIKLKGPSVVTFTFPQTEFMAVTAYQNSQFSQLKVDYNPFAKGLKEDGSSPWGLKLKLNCGKDLHKDGDTTTNEQHPVKKSLKSLLANHKPRTSKAADPNPSLSGDLQKNSTTNKDQSTPRESLCSNSRPAEKLFSELMREAHVSLQRCNVEQLGINHSTSHRTEQTNTKDVALKSNTQDFSKKNSMSVKIQSEILVTKRKLKEEKHILNSLNCKNDIKINSSKVSNVAASALAQTFSVDSGRKPNPDVPSDVNVKQLKRPVPLPLPALALFLKQHSTKSKKVKTKTESPTSALPSEHLSGSQSSAACLSSDHASNTVGLSKSLTVDAAETDYQTAECTGADIHPNEITSNVIGQADESAFQPSSLSCPNAVANTDSNGVRTESLILAERTLVLPISDQPLCAPATSPCLASSSTSPTFPPTMDTVLPAVKLPQTAAVTEGSTLSSDLPTMKPESLLSDPECSSLDFEPLSPASSLEPLPPLLASLGLDLDSGLCLKGPESLQHSKNSAISVFKWHTVLPPPEPYVDTFQPKQQPLPLPPITPSCLPCQTPSRPGEQLFCTSTPPSELAPSFQENEQSLPFPAELSPLVLQLPLSPTFSSLDGDGLSPTPSLADLVHFLSTDDDLGMGVEFPNTEAVAVPFSPPSTIEANAHEPSHQVQSNPAYKRKKKSQRHKLSKTEMHPKNDDSFYTKMQPNLEEVEEQLFISFTSKEALRLHIADSEEPIIQMIPEAHLQLEPNTPEKDTTETVEKRISAFEKILLRDLKLMKHRQVIHPVLQEVGLKMNLLDPTLAIDLQYLGVRLPIPPPGVSLEPLIQDLPPTQGASVAFVSRTGKTTDVTQIKGWREKFTPSEAPSVPDKPQAGPSSDLPKKNLSAFCSDMLDKYLEHEGKLLDERAASFSKPQVEPVVYELPTKSTSYVRTLDSILKKQPGSSPTSDIISGFIPPSKRPKLSLKEKKTSRKGERKPKGPKLKKPRLDCGGEQRPVSTNQIPKQPTALTSAVPAPPDHTAPITEHNKSEKKDLKVRFNHTEPLTLPPKNPIFKKRRKLKPKSSSQTLRPTAPTVHVSEDMAPLESDSELGAADRVDEPYRKDRGPMITRALLRQKDLEDRVVWEGQPRTYITEERAAIALTSLFTLMGFASENPTAPIQLVQRWAPPCLNEFCRLGCVCSSLSYCSRVSHCGRPQCMFGCSCLKQKVVLLKNLDWSDSSTSHHQNNKKRRRKRRMKMAYILKEADSVSQPAERVWTLWKRDSGGSDPDPVHVPEPSCLPRFTECRENYGSCARIRTYMGKKTTREQETMKDGKSKVVRLKSLLHRDLKPKKTKMKASIPPAAAEQVQLASSRQAPSPPSGPPPKPSKRLIILAECKWESDADRNHVLKTLCEAMAQDRLGDPFWIKKYLISPLTQTVEENGTDHCIQYKIHISTPKVEREKPPETQQKREGDTNPQQEDHLRQVTTEEGVLVDWQQEVMEEEAELWEDWQQEVEEGDIKEEGSKLPQVNDRKKTCEVRTEDKMNSMGLPFLTGISPAGFLSANKKKPGGTDHLVQVNGKLYPLAKIQLGKMGALHPANRLAAYLTGRVGSNKDKQVSSSSSKPPLASGLIPQTASSSSVLTSPTSTSTLPRPQLSVLTCTSSTDSQINTSVVRPVNPSSGLLDSKGSQMLMVEVLRSLRKVPVLGAVTQPPAPTTISQKIVLQPVQTALGVQYYRRPNGKLVRLVPVSQLRSGNPSLPLQRVLPPTGSSSPSGLPAAPLQTPAITVVKETLPLTTATTTPPTTSSVSSLRSVPPPSSPLRPASAFPPQKGICTFKILPASSNKEPIIITCPKVPLQAPTKVVPVPGIFTLLQPHPKPPVNLISLTPSPGEGAGLGVKTVTVSAVPVDLGGVSVPQKPASYQTCATQSPAETALRSTTVEVTPPPPGTSDRATPKPEMACNLVDLDIICVDDETMEVENMGASSSSETENSSDFESDADGEQETNKMNLRLLHNVLERKRRVQMKQLFEALKREVGLSHEKTSKITTLRKAMQMIDELRMTDRCLERKKRRLMKRRDEYLSTIAPTTGTTIGTAMHTVVSVWVKKWLWVFFVVVLDLLDRSKPDICRGQRLRESVNKQRRHKNRADADLVEVVDLLDETDEPTDKSSDKEIVVTKTTNIITVTNDKVNEVQCVAVETQGNSRLNVDQRRLAKMRNSESSLTVKKTVEAPSDTDICRALSSVLNTNTSPKSLLTERACEEIQRLKSLEVGLNRQQDFYITELSQRSGKSEMAVLGKLQQLSFKQKIIEKQERHQTVGPLPAPAGGRNSGAPTVGGEDSGAPTTGDMSNDKMIIISSEQQQTQQSPPNPMSITTPIQPSQMVLHLSNPVLTPPAPVLRDKPRTMPNILSRSKNPAPPVSLVTSTIEGEAPSFQALLPSEVLSLVGAALPGHPVLTLNPLMSGPAVLQTAPTAGVTSVSLNIPSLTNQQIHLTSLPRLPANKICNFSAPLTLTNLTATNFTNLLQLVQPATTQQLQLQQFQQQQLQQQQVPAGQPLCVTSSPVVSAGSDQTKDQDQDQDQPQSQTDLRPESSSSSPPSTQGSSSSLWPSLSPDGQVEIVERGPTGPDQQQETRRGAGTESLKSLLNEINFLNQQTLTAVTPVSSPGRRSPEVDAEQQDHPHSPWVLQLDSDSDDAVTMETEVAGITVHQKAPTNECNDSGVLAPPPLLQMHVGGAKVVCPANRNGPAGGGAVGRSTEEGVAWRPMPRLVPLGLRGNQTS